MSTPKVWAKVADCLFSVEVAGGTIYQNAEGNLLFVPFAAHYPQPIPSQPYLVGWPHQ